MKLVKDIVIYLCKEERKTLAHTGMKNLHNSYLHTSVNLLNVKYLADKLTTWNRAMATIDLP